MMGAFSCCSGTESSFTRDSEMESFYQYFARHEVVTLQDADHWLHFSKPNEVVCCSDLPFSLILQAFLGLESLMSRQEFFSCVESNCARECASTGSR